MLFKKHDQTDQTLESKCISCEWSKLIISPKCRFISLLYFQCLFLKPLRGHLDCVWFAVNFIWNNENIYQVCSGTMATQTQSNNSKKKEHLTCTLCSFSIQVIVSKHFFGMIHWFDNGSPVLCTACTPGLLSDYVRCPSKTCEWRCQMGTQS